MFDMYQENILDHAQHPRHWGLLQDYHLHAQDDNPLCGDALEITLHLDEAERVTALGWQGQGCAISQAAASMLGETLIGKTRAELQALSKEELLEMLGIPLSMNRLKCALLSLKVVKAAAYGIDSWEED